MEILLIIVALLILLSPFIFNKPYGYMLMEVRCKNANKPYLLDKAYPIKIWITKYNSIEVKHISGEGGIMYSDFISFNKDWEPIATEYKFPIKSGMSYYKYLKVKYSDRLNY